MKSMVAIIKITIMKTMMAMMKIMKVKPEHLVMMTIQAERAGTARADRIPVRS